METKDIIYDLRTKKGLSQEIAYHQCKALYIIKPQEDARWRVMRYSPTGADDMHRTSRGDDMPSLREPPKLAHSLRGTPTAAWIKKSSFTKNEDFL